MQIICLSGSCSGIGHPLPLLEKAQNIPIPPREALSCLPLGHLHLPFFLTLPLHSSPQPGSTLPFPQISPTLPNRFAYTRTSCTAVVVSVQGLTPPYDPMRLEVLPGGHHMPCRSVLPVELPAGLECPSDTFERQSRV